MPKTRKSNLKEWEASDLFNSKIKFTIYLYLEIYNSLSTNLLCSKLGKSKPTIFQHLKEMIEMELVEKTNYRDANGNVLYKLTSHYHKKLDIDLQLNFHEEMTLEKAKRISEIASSFFKWKRFFIDTEIEFYESVLVQINKGENESIVSLIKDIYNMVPDASGNLHFRTFNFIGLKTQAEFDIYRKKMFEVQEEIKKLESSTHRKRVQKDLENQQKPYFVLNSAMPLELMLDFINRTKNEKKSK
jgi:DNA-binding HxlR family transcriptional regulator